MDDHANEMEVIGGYSYTYPDVKIMSASMDLLLLILPGLQSPCS